MKFNEKLLDLRKKRGLSQEELGLELNVSRQTISKWEAGQSYPDFQRLVMLSDYFGMSLDELVRDLDVQDVRERSLTDERVASCILMWSVERAFAKMHQMHLLCRFVFLAFVVITFVIHLIFPEITWLWRNY